MNPVHSSVVATFFSAEGHFHAISNSPKLFRHFYFNRAGKQVNATEESCCRTIQDCTNGQCCAGRLFRTIPANYFTDYFIKRSISSGDRKAQSTEHRHKTRARVAPTACWFSGAE